MARKPSPMQMMGNPNVLLKQAKRAQKNMKEAKKRLAKQEHYASSSDGAASIVMYGDRTVKELTLDAEKIDGDMKKLAKDVKEILNEVLVHIADAENNTNNNNMADLRSSVQEQIRNGEMKLEETTGNSDKK